MFKSFEDENAKLASSTSLFFMVETFISKKISVSLKKCCLSQCKYLLHELGKVSVSWKTLFYVYHNIHLDHSLFCLKAFTFRSFCNYSAISFVIFLSSEHFIKVSYIKFRILIFISTSYWNFSSFEATFFEHSDFYNGSQVM